MRRLAASVIFGMVLVSCAPTSPVGPDIETGTGAILEVKNETEKSSASSVTTSDPLVEEAAQAAEASYPSTAEALQLSYQNAVAVRDVMERIIPNMAPEAYGPLSEALKAFSADIDELGKYVEKARKGPLTLEDNTKVMELSANIEEGMETFAQIIEMMP